jgi:hypothetical protein
VSGQHHPSIEPFGSRGASSNPHPRARLVGGHGFHEPAGSGFHLTGVTRERRSLAQADPAGCGASAWVWRPIAIYFPLKSGFAPSAGFLFFVRDMLWMVVYILTLVTVGITIAFVQLLLFFGGSETGHGGGTGRSRPPRPQKKRLQEVVRE